MADRYASLKQGLVGAWIPSISGSGLLLPDLSGRGNHGVLTNMSADDWVSGQYGRALDFDGTNDYVQLTESDALKSTNTLSLSFWLRRSLEGTQQFYMTRAGSGLNDNVNVFNQPDNTLNFGARNTGGTFTIASFSVAGRTDWLHVGCVYDGANKLHINGQLVSTSASYTMASTSVSSWTLAAGSLPVYRWATCQLDDVRIYNRALSESEIRLLASKRGVGLEPRKPKLLFHQFPSGAKRRLLLTGQT